MLLLWLIAVITSEPKQEQKPPTIETYQGTILQIDSLRPDVRLLIQTNFGQKLVDCGPSWYWQQENFFLLPGEYIVIRGVEKKIPGRSVITAYQITKQLKEIRNSNIIGRNSIRLREDNGAPLWVGKDPFIFE